MILLLLLIPTAAAVLSLIVPWVALRRTILVLAATAHTAVTLAAWIVLPDPLLDGWLMLDPFGLLFLTITSILFLACAWYTAGYLARETRTKKQDFEENLFFTNAPEAVFCGCLSAFLATMTLVTVSRHLGLLWVAMEATTLVTAPLIYFHRHHRSLEATWKYLLICSVGIALALLGNFFMAIAASGQASHASLALSTLMEQGANLNLPWLKAAFLFLLVGYGTKMGLAPLHTWLPDAHSESPSVISALLSGALLNCAFLGILRSYQICLSAGLGTFCRPLLILFGLISMGWAAVFILGQTDYKRMLAYSSVEHVGIMALGIGIGTGAVFGSLLHAVNHSLTKAMLFLLAGNILAVYKTKTITQVSGVLNKIPFTGILWIAGFLAITGIPPFGLFVSEFTIAKSMIEQDRFGIAAAFLSLLALIFIGMAAAFLRMAHGSSPDNLPDDGRPNTALTVVPSLALGILTLMLGLYLPPALSKLLHEAAAALGGL
jgi:hydrogenase-4 component F